MTHIAIAEALDGKVVDDQAAVGLSGECINCANELNGAAISDFDHLHGQCM
jgi:hypothetical protein